MRPKLLPSRNMKRLRGFWESIWENNLVICRRVAGGADFSGGLAPGGPKTRLRMVDMAVLIGRWEKRANTRFAPGWASFYRKRGRHSRAMRMGFCYKFRSIRGDVNR